MARYAGRCAAIYISTTEGGVASAISSATAWTLNGETQKIDATAFCDDNLVRRKGLPDRSGTFTAFYDDTDTKIFTAADSAGPVKVYLYIDVESLPTHYFYGPADIDFSVTASVNEMVQVNGTFTAAGSWGDTIP
jgi:hypothetical protein